MRTRVDIVARKLKREDEADQEAKEYCSSEDEECLKMAKALVKIRKLAEKQRKFHSFEKYAYSELDDSLKEAGF